MKHISDSARVLLALWVFEFKVIQTFNDRALIDYAVERSQRKLIALIVSLGF